MALKPKNRTRAIATAGNNIGITRYQLYKRAYARINESIKQEFYLEAISIIESLISDRLESRLTFLKGSDFGFKTLGQLISEINKVEADSQLKDFVTKNLDSWRFIRNKALHEMAKLEQGNILTWDDRMKDLAPCAKDGLIILRFIDRRCSQLRKLK
ncbi:MAG: hypothetical protein WAT67_02175 [Candidatus Contendobacter sp.]